MLQALTASKGFTDLSGGKTGAGLGRKFWTHHQSSLTRILAADSGLVTDGGDPSAAVTISVCHVQVDLETVDLGADTVVVIELPPTHIFSG